MKLFRLMALLLCTGMLSTLTQAEEISLPLSPEIQSLNDIYTVEILLFEQASPAVNEEFWSADSTPPSLASAFAPRSHNGMPMSLGETLPRTSFALTGESSRLSRSGYRVLYHNSWVQQFSPNSRSTVMLSDPGAGLEGTIRIERQRFLHVYPDISLNLAQYAGQMGAPVRMNESRRMRSSELHYIDHPVMGMLVLFRPVNKG